jgi:hypothetical protein
MGGVIYINIYNNADNLYFMIVFVEGVPLRVARTCVCRSPPRLMHGARTSPTISPAAAQGAAVIVDPMMLNRATAVLEDHTAEMHRIYLAG